jgi:hypothetical protein
MKVIFQYNRSGLEGKRRPVEAALAPVRIENAAAGVPAEAIFDYVVEATAAEGVTGTLAPWPLRIVE